MLNYQNEVVPPKNVAVQKVDQNYRRKLSATVTGLGSEQKFNKLNFIKKSLAEDYTRFNTNILFPANEI